MAKVLIVGSAELGTDLERTILWTDGIERALVSTPGGALEVARAFVPSLVVVDGADAAAALGLIRRLRENAGTRRSSIVVVSRQPGLPEEELRQAGANLVLTGPVDPPVWNAGLEELFVVPRRVRMRLPVRVVPRNADEVGEPILAMARDLMSAGLGRPKCVPLGVVHPATAPWPHTARGQKPIAGRYATRPTHFPTTGSLRIRSGVA